MQHMATGWRKDLQQLWHFECFSLLRLHVWNRPRNVLIRVLVKSRQSYNDNMRNSAGFYMKQAIVDFIWPNSEVPPWDIETEKLERKAA